MWTPRRKTPRPRRSTRHRVVEVAGGLAVDGDGDRLAQVVAAGPVGGTGIVGERRGHGQRRRREAVGDAVVADDHVDVHPRRLDGSPAPPATAPSDAVAGVGVQQLDTTKCSSGTRSPSTTSTSSDSRASNGANQRRSSSSPSSVPTSVVARRSRRRTTVAGGRSPPSPASWAETRLTSTRSPSIAPRRCPGATARPAAGRRACGRTPRRRRAAPPPRPPSPSPPPRTSARASPRRARRRAGVRGRRPPLRRTPPAPRPGAERRPPRPAVGRRREGTSGARRGRPHRREVRLTPLPALLRIAAARESGGIGRRARFRILWSQDRGGSSPPFRTNDNSLKSK